MNNTVNRLHRSNPFSTRYTRPGALEFIFPAGVSSSQLVDRFVALGNLGAIVGPHGSGKSTLLQTLLAAFDNRGYRPVLIPLHDGQRKLPGDWRARMACTHSNDRPLLIIDGYEQLSHWHRWTLANLRRRHSWPLLVTSHARTNLPCLFETEPTATLLVSLTQKLLPGDNHSISLGTVTQAFTQNAGNIRESLFTLYDAFELGENSGAAS